MGNAENLGASINAGDRTPLHYAAQAGRADVARALVGSPRFKWLVNQIDINGWTALHFAAAHGHAEVCNIILNSPYFVAANAISKWHETALALAIRHRQRNVISLFGCLDKH